MFDTTLRVSISQQKSTVKLLKKAFLHQMMGQAKKNFGNEQKEKIV